MSADTAITEPGIYPDIPEVAYHRDPVPGGSLSSSGARDLLDCPARFAWKRAHPEYKRIFDFGSAAHKSILGTGPDIVVIDAKDYRTKAAQQEQAAAREAGKVPLLPSEVDKVASMQAALEAHPLAYAALDPRRGGKPEQTLIAQDPDSGVWLRARLDWMPDPHASVRPVIFDYKTTACAEKSAFAKSMANYGYHIQAAFYAALYYQLTGVDAPFLFIAQEKEAPYLVTVCQPDADAMRAGRAKVREAIEIYAACSAVDEWPGYPEDIHSISLPHWQREDYL